MAYTQVDYKTKADLLYAVKKGTAYIKHGMPFSSLGNDTGVSGFENKNGFEVVEGPQYPKPHKWYVECVIENWRLVSAK